MKNPKGHFSPQKAEEKFKMLKVSPHTFRPLSLSLTSRFSRPYSNSSGNDKKEKPPILSRFFRFVSFKGPIESALKRTGLSDDPILISTVARTISISSQLLLASSFLGTVGVDTKPLIAGLGITGFTVGFALKDIATNFLSGLMLVLNRPFKQGWRVRLFNGSTAYEGIVKTVDIRYVHLELSDRHRVLLPSYVVYSNPIIVLENADDAGSAGDNSTGEKQ